MKVINIKVTDQLTVTSILDGENVLSPTLPVKIASGNYKSVVLNFEFASSTWNEVELEKNATFNIEGQEKIQVELEKIGKYENACYLPYRVAKRNCKVNIGVYGTSILNGTIEKVVSAENLYFLIVDGSFSVFLTDETPQKVETIKEDLRNYTDELKKAFDTNSDTKVEEFNTNANNQLEIFNENAESYDNRITEVSNRLYRVEQDLFDSGVANGKFINIKDSALAEFQELTIDGVSEQETTSGKNLLRCVKTKTETINGVTFTPFYNNGLLLYINVNGTSTANTNFYISTDSFTNNETLRAGTYTLSDGVIGEDGTKYFTYVDVELSTDYNLSTVAEKTVIIPQETKLKSRIVVRSGVTLNNVKFYPQLEYSSNATKYEPYTGEQPSPSPKYPQPIHVIEEDFDLVTCGNSLVDFSKPNVINPACSYNFINDTIATSCKNGSYVSTTFDVTGIFKMNASKMIYFNYEKYNSENGEGPVVQLNVNYADGSQEYISLLSRDEIKKAYTIPKNVDDIKQFVLGIYPNNHIEKSDASIEIYKPILSFDENAIYEPYQESRQTITLPESEFAGEINESIKDMFRLEFNEETGDYHLYLDKFVGRRILTGNDAWEAYTNSYTNLLTYRLRFYEINTLERRSIICSHFTAINASADVKDGQINNRYGNYSNLECVNLNVTNLDEFKVWLNDNNVELYYILAEPYTLDLGIINMPLTYYPITNVFTTHKLQPEINVMYYRDFKTTIVAMQNNQNSMQEIINSHSNKILALETAIKNMQPSPETFEESGVSNNDLQVE